MYKCTFCKIKCGNTLIVKIKRNNDYNNFDNSDNLSCAYCWSSFNDFILIINSKDYFNQKYVSNFLIVFNDKAKLESNFPFFRFSSNQVKDIKLSYENNNNKEKIKF